jgi:hypothetical protein
MIIKMTNCGTNVEIELDDDASIFEATNAFRAACYAIGYDIESIGRAIPPIDYECR